MPRPAGKRPGFNALRKGRVDQLGATYFLTVTLQRPVRTPSGLMDSPLRTKVMARWTEIEIQENWSVICVVVMPDHVHLVCRLNTGTVAEAVRRSKGGLSPVLRFAGLRWQTSFYDHRLRPSDPLLGVVRYMWLNPYRAGLVSANEVWDGWYANDEVRGWLADPDAIDGMNRVPRPEWWQR